MKKVILEETFLITKHIWCSDNYNSIKSGLYKRLSLNDGIVWICINDGTNRYGYRDNSPGTMDIIKQKEVFNELEKLYLATTREEQMKSILE